MVLLVPEMSNRATAAGKAISQALIIEIIIPTATILCCFVNGAVCLVEDSVVLKYCVALFMSVQGWKV